MADPALRASCGAKALAKAATFSNATVQQRMVDNYHEAFAAQVSVVVVVDHVQDVFRDTHHTLLYHLRRYNDAHDVFFLFFLKPSLPFVFLLFLAVKFSSFRFLLPTTTAALPPPHTTGDDLRALSLGDRRRRPQC